MKLIAIVAVIASLAVALASPEDEGPVPCSALSCHSMKDLVKKYFPSTYQNDMLCIAYYESSYCPGAVNPSSGATGLWQIMPNIWLGQPGCPPKGDTSALLDADKNANCAATVLSKQGLTAWSTWDYGDCKNWSHCTV